MAIALYGAAASASVARGPVSEIVICAAEGPTVIHIDADGNKVKPRACCECLQCLAFAADVPSRAELGGRQDHVLPFARPFSPDSPILSVAHLRPQPRGPPGKAIFPIRLEFRQVTGRCGVTQTGRPFEDVR
jgi:hypothetical protein